jgi:hypothetical protein
MVRIQNRRFNRSPIHFGYNIEGVHAETQSGGSDSLSHVDSIGRARDLKGAHCKAPQRKLKGWTSALIHPTRLHTDSETASSGITGESLWRQPLRLYLEGLARFVLPPHRLT